MAQIRENIEHVPRTTYSAIIGIERKIVSLLLGELTLRQGERDSRILTI